MSEHSSPTATAPTRLLPGGEMGERTRAFDWSQTPVGPLGDWPQSLRTVVRIMLDSRYAMWLGWGAEFTFFYNDAYARMTLGPKHPWALGRPARDVWSEIWADVGPRAESVLHTGQATWDEGLLLFLQRRGFAEETYHTFSYSPVPDDHGRVGGLLCVVTEDTERTIGERRLRTLRELASRTNDVAKSVEEACQSAARTLASNPQDLPFILLYLLSDDGQRVRLLGRTGLESDSAAAPAEIEIDQARWPFQQVATTGEVAVLDDLQERFGPLTAGAWPEPVSRALVLPMLKPGQTRPTGYVIAGISPRRLFDDSYKGFLDLLTGHIATAIANARAYSEERRRAEALAELDRAKTAFFSNVSHEFRTPLTLMLSPLEDMLARPAAQVPRADRESLTVVQRNGLRLQRLVNTLLDFSRIEAGRVRAAYEPTDLAAFTADLASNFRSACEKAGLRLHVDCPPLSELVYVDRQMWEKIVLNLLSNAFKFTFTGEIRVSLIQSGRQAELRVRDTGTGIPPEEMPRLFERFHRVENAQGRTHEGSGIGLALVQELVKLHGGSISAESETDRGTTFLLSIPLGSAHLPREQIGNDRPLASTTARANPFIEEALRWLPEKQSRQATEREAPSGQDLDFLPESTITGVERPHVLIADDNADMRSYLARLLSNQYRVEAVPDGLAALAAIQRQMPHLIVSDVMMPRLDGFGLLRTLRTDTRTASVPVILLSARAGEESRVEGMEAGADDYLVKPFSARELLARIGALLQISRLRRESERAIRLSEERFRTLFEAMSEGFAILEVLFDDAGRPHDVRHLELNPAFERHTGLKRPAILGRTMLELFPAAEPLWIERFGAAATSGQPLHFQAKFGPLQRWFEVSAYCTAPRQIAIVFFDITDQKRAAERERQLLVEAATANAKFQAFFDQGPVFAGVMALDGTLLDANRLSLDACGYTREQVLGKRFWDCPWWNRSQQLMDIIRAGSAQAAAGELFRVEMPYFVADGSERMVDFILMPIEDDQGQVVFLAPTGTDITDRKLAEGKLRKSEERMRLLWEAAEVLLTTDEPDAMLRKLFAKIAPHLKLDTYFNFMVNEARNGLRLASCTGIPDETARDIEHLAFGQAICGKVAQQRQAIVATFIQESDDPKVQLVKSFGIRTYACNPLIAADQLLGTLSFASRTRDQFAEEDLDFLQTICQYVTAAYERLRLISQLQDADRRKDEFLATLAHELRNPLAPLRNGLQVMKLAQNNPEAIELSRAMMDRQLGQMVRLIDDLLDLSRISRGKIELRKERIELSKAVQQAVETSRPAIEQAGHTLALTIPPVPIFVDADLTRLSQVFANLLNNSAKYTEPGGHIRLSVERQESDAVVRVNDNGIGIPSHMLVRVFDMFTQVGRNLERSQGGLGIGLSIVKRLVEMHGGTVEAQSEGLDLGSMFEIRLPVALSVVSEQILAGSGSNRTISRRILVVDDNRDAAISLAMMLKLMGNELQTAHDGLQALDVVPVFKPDIILLDIGMPKLNGYETARRIRQQPWGQHTLLVALTGWGQDEDRRQSQEAGFDFHMTKPVDLAALEKLLAESKADTA